MKKGWTGPILKQGWDWCIPRAANLCTLPVIREKGMSDVISLLPWNACSYSGAVLHVKYEPFTAAVVVVSAAVCSYYSVSNISFHINKKKTPPCQHLAVAVRGQFVKEARLIRKKGSIIFFTTCVFMFKEKRGKKNADLRLPLSLTGIMSSRKALIRPAGNLGAVFTLLLLLLLPLHMCMGVYCTEQVSWN